MSTMRVTCFLYLMMVIKPGELCFQNSYFFKKLQCGIFSGPETGRSFRATFQFVFSKFHRPPDLLWLQHEPVLEVDAEDRDETK